MQNENLPSEVGGMSRTQGVNGDYNCTCCGAPDGRVFYQIAETPANSCLLIGSRQEAIDFPSGALRLASCHQCGFVWNVAFDPALTEYSDKYEETQGFSPTFGSFHRRLALDLIARYDLRRKRIVEIGCGKGEFLSLLCELGDNTGVGFDPAYREGRLPPETSKRLTFIKDLYSEQYADVRGDFVCCKMTLEHIANPKAFVETLRKTLGYDSSVVVFIQVPDAGKIIEEGAFEDFYYEHCSYFSQASLGRLFQLGGFSVLSVESVYDRQYLAVAARPTSSAATPALFDKELAAFQSAVESFPDRCEANRRHWQERLTRWQLAGKKVVLWGSGSKAVGLLTAVQVPGAVEFVVDINPHKAGSFMAGTGQQIVPPESLRDYRPDVVIVMNSIYRQEIAEQLQELGQQPLLLTLR